MLLRSIIVCSLAAVITASVHGVAGDWPGWRGPNRDDISTETGLLKSWPEGGPKKLWTSADVGLGYSGMAVAEGAVYTLGATSKESDGTEQLIALDAATGEKIWATSVGPVLDNNWGGGPRSTPTVAGDRVVVLSGTGELACVARNDGTKLWSVNMKDYGGRVPDWGYTESPLVDGETVICTPGGKQGTVLCLNLANGEKIWQSADITSIAHYSSIIAADHFGKRQYIKLTVDKVFGLDANSGTLLWQHDWPGKTAVIPTPIYRDGQVYVTSGYGVGCMLLTISKDNEVSEVYKNLVMKNHHGGVIQIGDHLYGHSDSVGWVCQNFATGEQIWNENGKNGSKGAVAFADGMLFCLGENDGDCVLAEASPAGWKEISRFRLEPQTQQRAAKGKVWTHPTIANGKLYLRDQEFLSCYEIKE